MPRCHFLFGLAAWCFLFAARAQIPAYVDDRQDRYEFPAGSMLSRAAEAVMFHYGTSQLTPGPNGTYQISVVPRTEFVPGQPWCPSVRYYRQPQSAGGTTAVLVGKRHVLVANHTLPVGATASSRAFVFGFELTAPWVPGDPVTKFSFPASSVYFGETIVHSDFHNDWALIRLNRDVPGTTRPLVVRSRTGLDVGESAALIGFPEHIPLKGQAVEVFGARVNARGFQEIDVVGQVRAGSSGGPLVGLRTGVLDGFLVGGSASEEWSEKCGAWVDDFDPPPVAGCFFPMGLSALLPPLGVQVSPELETVIDHYGPLGGPFSREMMRVDLTSPPDTVGALRWRASALDPNRAGIVGPFARTPRPSVEAQLQPGQSTPVFEQLLRLAEWTSSPGVHETRIEVKDLTLGTSGIHLHRVHAGVDGFSVSPETGIGLDGPGAPPDARAVYTLTNRHIVPQVIRIEPREPWILVNGMASAQVEIPASSQLGGKGTVEIEIRFDASGVSPGVRTGDIRFRPVIPGWESDPELGAVHRSVRVDFGREVFASLDTPVELPVPSIGVVQILVDRPIESIADLDVSYWLETPSTPNPVIAQFTLISPSGTAVLLHSARFVSGEPAVGILDDETSPASVGMLSVFDGEVPMGVWTVLLELDVFDGPDTRCTVRDVSLRITPSVPE